MTEPIRIALNRCAPDGIVGWALHPSGVRAIRVLVDQRPVGEATLGLARPDVAKAFLDAPHSATAGFEFYFPPGTYDPGRPAAVRIEVEAADGSQDAVSRTLAARSVVPYPPLPLINRVGSLETEEDPLAAFDWMGANCKASLLRVLPRDWSWPGKRVLDLGCGAGRLLRQFIDEARQGFFCGCDIDEESVAWLTANLSPPFEVKRNTETPPLSWEDSTFDLIYAISVFTHISDLWAEWLLEVHRLLAPGGLAILTFNGRGFYHLLAREPWVEDRVGMNTICHGNNWTFGGPMVFHAPWWIREHWGRLFDILDLRDQGFGGAEEGPGGQGVVLVRRRPASVSREELIRVRDDDPREMRAMRHNLDQLKRESTELRHNIEQAAHAQATLQVGLDEARASNVRLQAELDEVRASNVRLQAELDYMRHSISWRTTAPLRVVRAIARRHA